MPAERPHCADCGTEVDPNRPGTWQRATGWVQRRSAGGSNALFQPEYAAEYLCSTCQKARQLTGARGPVAAPPTLL